MVHATEAANDNDEIIQSMATDSNHVTMTTDLVDEAISFFESFHLLNDLNKHGITSTPNDHFNQEQCPAPTLHGNVINLGWRSPLEVLTGSTPDISILLRFGWWDPVLFHQDDSAWPSESTELSGRIVGVAEHVGHAMTWEVLSDDTQKVLHCANVRPDNDPAAPNKHLCSYGGDDYPPPDFIKAHTGPTVVKSDGESAPEPAPENGEPVSHENGETASKGTHMPIVDASDLIGRTFLTDNEDGSKHRARIVQAIEEHEDATAKQSNRVKFVCSMNDDEYEEIMSYNDIVQHIEASSSDGEVMWQFKQIIGHEGPITNNYPSWKGSTWNVRVEWENGEISDEPLTAIAADDPVTCAIYARENNLLPQPGWKQFKGIAKRQKKLFRMVKRHTALSFHRVREAIAAKIISFHHIQGTANPADVVSKYWYYGYVWKLLQPILYG